jgi:DNA topoisomerase-3
LLGASFTRLQTLYFRKIFEKYIDSKEIKKFSKPSYENNYSNKVENNKDSDNNENTKKDFTNKYGKSDNNYNLIISYGPCQFPTLNFIVERNEEIKSFVSKNFYSLIFKLNRDLKASEIKLLENTNSPNKIKNGSIEVDFQWAKERVDEKDTAEELRLKLQKAFKSQKNTLKVIEAKKKNKIKNRPLPINTVEMQKLISRKLKIQSHKTMTIAEKLYHLGYISYPRTETQVYSKNENLRKIVENLCSNVNDDSNYDWIPYAKRLLNSGKNLVAREGKLNDNSHPPISPVKFAKKSDLTNEEFKIYNLLVYHFLASVSEDAYGDETEIKIGIEDEEFTAKGFHLIKKGFLEVYPYEEWNDKFIPEFQKDEIINYSENSKFEVTEGKTKPPAQMSEAELIELMDKNGIGTDATIHEHIKTIKER